MRDAFGSTFMFKIIIIFIVAYVSFMTIAVSYAKIFRIKNHVIDILEQTQYDYRLPREGGTGDITAVLDDKVDVYLDSVAYDYSYDKDKELRNQLRENCKTQMSDNGVCISPHYVENNKVYYTVTVYLVITFPFFDYNFIIPVSGETETIFLYD